MEGSPSVPAAPHSKFRQRRVLALLVAIAVVVAAVVAWQVLRPRPIDEVLSMQGLQAGSEVSLQGTITEIGQETTSYGPRSYLRLDDNHYCGGQEAWTGNVLEDPNASDQLDVSYQTTLRFEAFQLDGRPGVWTPRLPCPFPSLYRSIALVVDAVSQVRDMLLVYNRTDAGGWSRYDIRSQNATGFDPARLPVDLLKTLPFDGRTRPIVSASGWRDSASVFYLMTSAALSELTTGFSVADRMTSLASPASANGLLRFVDADLNSRVNSGDGLDIRLPSGGAPNQWTTYIVRIGNWSGFAPPYGAAVHVVLVGPAGPFEALSPVTRISSPEVRPAGR